MSKRALLAKLSPPRFCTTIVRERLHRRLDQARAQPVVWISAPPGAGKTTLATTYLESRGLPALWYQVDAGDADPATFFYYMGQAAESNTRGKRKPLPFLTPEYLPDLPGFGRRFFREVYRRLPSQAALILDNFQEAASDSPFHGLIHEAMREIPAGISLIVISRAGPPPQCTRAIANNLIAQIGWEELRLTREETAAIATAMCEIDVATLRSLQELSEGWAAGVVLMLERFKQTGTVNRISHSETMDTVFNYFAGQVFDQAPTDMRSFLLRTACLPRLTAKMAEDISSDPEAGKRLEYLYRQGRRLIDRGRREGSADHLDFENPRQRSRPSRAIPLLSSLGLTVAQVTAARRFVGRRLDGRFLRYWQQAIDDRARRDRATVRRLERSSDPAERAQARALAREVYNRVRGNFWRLVMNDTRLSEMIQAAGMRLPDRHGGVPYYQLSGRREYLTLDHTGRVMDTPSASIQGNQLVFSLSRENSGMLEGLRDTGWQRAQAEAAQTAPAGP